MQSLIKLVHDLDVVVLDSLGLVSAPLVEILKFATLSHFPDGDRCVIELGSLGNGQVKVDIAVTLQKIVLNTLAHELKNLILDLIVVHE